MSRDPLVPVPSLSESLARVDRALATRSLEAVLAPSASPGGASTSAALVVLGGVAAVAAVATGVAWLAAPAVVLLGLGGMRVAGRMGSRSRTGAWIGVGAELAPDARLEAGAVVEPGATVRAKAWIQSGAVVRMGATVGEGAVIERNAVVGWGVDVHARAVVGRGAKVGAGSDVHEGAKVGAGATIGFGADVHAGAVVENGVHVGTGSDVHPGATGGRGTWVNVGGDVTEGTQAREPMERDARDGRIDAICDRIEAELREAPETMRALLEELTRGVQGLKRTCHELTAKERALRAESAPESFARLEREEQALRGKLEATSDARVRASLEGALTALTEQRRHREQLRGAADRLEAEQTRLTWTLEGIATQLVHLRAAGVDSRGADPVLDQSVRQLGEEIDAIATALEEVGGPISSRGQ